VQRERSSLFSHLSSLLSQAVNAGADHYLCYSNLGAIYADLADRNGARSDATTAYDLYSRALLLDPTAQLPLHNLGALLSRLDMFDLARQVYTLQSRVHGRSSLSALGGLLVCAEELLLLDTTRQHMESRLVAAMHASSDNNSDQILHPFHALAYSKLGPIITREHCRRVEARVRALSRPQLAPTWLLPPCSRSRGAGRLAVGLFSGDFRPHPVTKLVYPVLSVVKQEGVKLQCFSFTPSITDAYIELMMTVCDEYVDVEMKGDEEIAATINERKTHVLLDLSGWTEVSRTGALFFQPAAVQVTYMGFLASLRMGNVVDFILTDRIAVTPEMSSTFDERMMYLPAGLSYLLPSFSSLPDATPPTQDEVAHVEMLRNRGEKRFIFVSLNRHTKLHRQLLEVWARILRRSPSSELWLLDSMRGNEEKGRVWGVFEREGVDKERVLFLPRVSATTNAERLRLADLYLDTFPYSGGATAVDALMSSVPVLTLAGEVMIARSSASLGHACEGGSMVVRSVAEYEDAAAAAARTAKSGTKPSASGDRAVDVMKVVLNDGVAKGREGKRGGDACPLTSSRDWGRAFARLVKTAFNLKWAEQGRTTSTSKRHTNKQKRFHHGLTPLD